MARTKRTIQAPKASRKFGLVVSSNAGKLIDKYTRRDKTPRGKRARRRRYDTLQLMAARKRTRERVNPCCVEYLDDTGQVLAPWGQELSVTALAYHPDYGWLTPAEAKRVMLGLRP